MKEPLAQFAKRIIRNDEVAEFIRGLIEEGVPPQKIVDATKPPEEPAPWDDSLRYKFNS